MSMILSASVVRVRDGLPLSASTDYEQSMGMQQCRKYFKTLSKKLAQLPDRCTLKAGQYNIKYHSLERCFCGKRVKAGLHYTVNYISVYTTAFLLPVFISSLGVSYMMLCTENYPSVLAFCFLDELQKEFITTYNMMRNCHPAILFHRVCFKYLLHVALLVASLVVSADICSGLKIIPSFGDNFIQRTKQRYNNPRSLSTKINLADMQTEIKLRPPYQISMSELGSTNGFAHLSAAEFKGTAPHQRLEAVTLPGIVSFILSLLCGALNLIRGFHAIESLLQNEGEDFSYVIAFFLGTAACLYQCYLFLYCTGWRNVKSFLTFGLICLCNMYLYELRNLWQLFFHVTVGAFSALQIRLRQPQGKSPDYNV